MTTERRARRARRVVATAALGGVALAAAGCNLGEAPVLYPGPSGRVEAADLDDDGDLDLVTVRSRGEEDDASAVLLNDGDGAFTSTEAPATPWALADLALADFDGDGHVDRVDLVRGPPPNQGVGSIVLHRGDGAGGFAPAVDLVTDGVGDPARIALDDMDGDGDLDVVTTHGFDNYDRVGVWPNDGAGGLGSPVVDIHTPVTGGGLVTGDLDGDGASDVVVGGLAPHDAGGRFPAATVLLGDGTGGLGAPAAPVAAGPAGTSATGVTLADVDEDGALDVVGVNTDAQGEVWWLAGDGDGGLAPAVFSPATGGLDLDVGDVDGDGHLDVVTAARQGTGGTVLYGDGAGRFGDAHALGGGGTLQATAVVVAPLDAGTSPDVVFGRGAWNTPSDTSVLLNTRGGRRGH